MATNTIKKDNIVADSSIRVFKILSDSTVSYIPNAKNLLSSFRNPILCWHTDQSGYMRLFILFANANQGNWTLTVQNILNAGSVTAEISGNDIKLNNIGGYGNGIAIGLGT